MAGVPATDRLARILAMVPWIASQDAPRVAEVCERFGITREQLAADLDVVFVVGLYPYTPDSLIEVDLGEDYVSIAYTNFFERPLRLSREEALAILAAGMAAAGHAGHDPDGPLARGVAKIAAALGIDLGDDLDVVIDPAIARHHRILDRAVSDREVVNMRYYSHARNESTERDVEPRRLFFVDGAWYLDAHCRLTDEGRVFRLDRIDEARATGEHGTSGPDDNPTPRSPVVPDEAFGLSGELPSVRLEIDTDHGWVLERYPATDVEMQDGGRIRLTLPVSARPWLERLLVQLGPSVDVLDAPSDLVDAGSDAAARLLDRYTDRTRSRPV